MAHGTPNRSRRKRGSETYREKWKSAVTKTATLTAPTKLFLTSVLAQGMDTTGRVSTPRNVLADRMGCDERTVSRYIQKAKEAGWLAVANAGHRGMTAVYRAAFPNPERVTPVVTLSSKRKGDRFYHPLRVTVLSPFTPRAASRKGDNCCHPKSSYLRNYATSPTIDQSAHGHVPNDDAWTTTGHRLTSRREAPTTEQLILTADPSSFIHATRHPREVPA